MEHDGEAKNFSTEPFKTPSGVGLDLGWNRRGQVPDQ